MSRPDRGFSLIEIMTVVAIVSIIATLAIGLGRDVGAQNLYAEGAGFVPEVVTKCRAEAMRRNGKLVLAIDATTLTCFADSDDNFVWANGEKTILTHVMPGTVTLTSTFEVLGAFRVVVFDSRGYALDTDGNYQAGTIFIADHDPKLPRSGRVEVTIAGAIRQVRQPGT